MLEPEPEQIFEGKNENLEDHQSLDEEKAIQQLRASAQARQSLVRDEARISSFLEHKRVSELEQ